MAKVGGGQQVGDTAKSGSPSLARPASKPKQAAQAPPAPPHKTLLEYSGAAPSRSEELKRKAAALYVATRDQAAAPPQAAAPSPKPKVDPRLAFKEPAAPAQPASSPALPSIEQLMAAPRYGLNARELLLRATEQLAAAAPAPAPAPNRVPRRPGAPAPTPAPAARFNPMKLLEAVPPAARPQVEYSPRSSIPRLQRQGCSDTLLGQYLGLLLGLCKLAKPGDEDKVVQQAIKSNEAVRKLACTCAAAHESWLYKQVTGKQAYGQIASSAKAQATRLLIVEHGGKDLQAVLEKYGLNEAQVKEDSVAKPGSGDASQTQPGVAQGGAQGPAEKGLREDEDLFGEESESESEGEDDGSGGGGDDDVGGDGVLGVGVEAVEAAPGSAGRPSCDEQPEDGGLSGSGGTAGDRAEMLGASALLASNVESGPQRLTLTSCSIQQGGGSEQGPEPECTDKGLAEEQAPAAKRPRLEPQGATGGSKDSCNAAAGIDSELLQPPPKLPDVANTAEAQATGVIAAPAGTLATAGSNFTSDASAGSQQGVSEVAQTGQPKDADRPQAGHGGGGDGAQAGQQGGGEGPQAGQQGGGDGPQAAGQDTGVTAQVAEFVRGVLEPYIRAQLLNKQQYKDIIRRAVHKVMAHHRSATSAAFLLKEHEAVRKLVMKLVEVSTAQQAT